MKITIYTTENCVFCDKSKKYLKGKGLPYEEILVDTKERVDELFEKTGKKSVPQIFIDGKHIGGYIELVKLDP